MSYLKLLLDLSSALVGTLQRCSLVESVAQQLMLLIVSHPGEVLGHGSSSGAQRQALSLRVQKVRVDRWARVGGERNYHARQLCRYGGIARADREG